MTLVTLALAMMFTVPAFGATKYIKASTKKVTVTEGQKVTLKIKKKKIRFKAKNTAIAKITKKGVLTAKKAGTVKIKYKLGKKTKTLKIIVKAKKTEKATEEDDDPLVWKSATGKKYHKINNCGTMNPDKATQITESEAIKEGLTKCKNCW